MAEVATKDTRNIYERLLAARQDFLAANVKKSGVNRFAEFEYFELSDIVPVATQIFAKHRLIMTVSFGNDDAIGYLVNIDNPSEMIPFTSPMRTLDFSKIKGMNALQGLGSEETYQRRYLYMVALDIVEQDTIDGSSGNPSLDASEGAQKVPKASTGKSSAPAKPASKAERDAIKKELTDADGNADDQQIKAIKRGLKALRDKDPSQEVYIAECMSKLPTTKNPGRTISKKDAEDMQIEIGNRLEAAATEG